MGISLKVVEWLRTEGYETIHLRDQALHRLKDPLIFSKAVDEGRVLLTFDLDFGEIASLSGGQIVSVILFRLRNTRTVNVIARLASVLTDASKALEEGAIVIVEDSRHRVRMLPIRPAE